MFQHWATTDNAGTHERQRERRNPLGRDRFENPPACCLVSVFFFFFLLAIISVEMNRSKELKKRRREGGVIGGDRAEGNKRGQAQIVAGD